MAVKTQVNTDAVQTLVNKTLTAPAINTPVVVGGTLNGVTCTADPAVALGTATKQYVDAGIAGAAINSVLAGNPVINPNMEVWQRGTTFPAAASATYSADRWRWGQVGTGVVTLNRSTVVPSVANAGVLFNYSLEVDVTTADASIAAGDLYVQSTRIEGANWRHFAQRQITVSFWISSTKTGVHCLALRNNAAGTPDRCYVAEYTVAVADTPQYVTLVIPASPSAGTWDYTTGVGIELAWTLAAGSTFQTTAGSWQTGNFYGTANQVNVLDNSVNFFRITGVRLDIGASAVPIQYRSFQDELALCQRYFQKSFPYATAPAQNAGVAGAYSWISPVTATGAFGMILVSFTPRMRIAPTTFTAYNPLVANAQARNNASGIDDSSTTFGGGLSSENSAPLTFVTNAGNTVTNTHLVHWTADAEL